MGGCVSVRKISSKKVTDISLKATTMATAAKGITKKPYESVTNKNYNIFGRGSSGNSGCSSSPSSSGFFSNPSTSTSKTHNSGVCTQKLSKKRNKYFLRAHPICDNFGKHKLISNEKPMPLNIPSGYTLRNNSDYSKTFEEGRYVITNNTIKNYSTALISEAAEICTKSLNENTLGKTSTPILKRGISEEFGYKSDYDKWRNNLISKVPWQIQSNCMDSSNIPWICSDNSNISILTLTFDQDNAEKTMAETFLHSVGEVANAAELMGKTSTPLPSRRIMKTSNITNYSKWLNYLHNSSDCSTNNSKIL